MNELERIEQRLPYLPSYMIEIEQGWAPLVHEILDFMDQFAIKGKVRQIKQKFATLRFYCDVPDDYQQRDRLNAKIREVEDKAKHTCETCGQPGSSVIKNGWISIRCTNHRD